MKIDKDEEHICYKCIYEEYLSAEIKVKGKRRKCNYCTRTSKTYSLVEIVERIERAFSEHYERTDPEPSDLEYRLHHEKESSYSWYRGGQSVYDILINELGINPKAAKDLQEELADRHSDFDSAAYYETEFDSESQYDPKGFTGERWQKEWQNFEKIVKSESRYFNQRASTYLNSIFEGIEHLKSLRYQPVIVEAGPGMKLDSLFRARVFQHEDRLLETLCHPDNFLGTPPSALATAGRMNAAGIAVFYGATGQNVALSEVRPPVGSRVVVGRFEVLRKLKLIDLKALSNAWVHGSVFDPTFAERQEKTSFLRSLSERLVMAVMPDQENFEYLATQVVADFLASNQTPEFDGIIFPSVQTGGEKSKNVVLFHKSAKIRRIELVKGTNVVANSKVYEEDGEYDSYNVSEILPEKSKTKKVVDDMYYHDLYGFIRKHEGVPADDLREASLKVDLENIYVHHVKSASYKTKKHFVSRGKIEAIEEDDLGDDIFKAR